MSSDRKKRKVTGEAIDYINSLPEEVLCIIFDKLSLSCVKKASLVCKRWAEIIFMSPYIRRFNLVISFHRPQREEKTRDKLKQLIRILPESQRCYRSLYCYMKDWDDHEFRAFREVFVPKLASLQFICFLTSGVLTSEHFSLIAEVILSISGLQELQLITLDNHPDSDSKLTLRSSSIKRLLIERGLGMPKGCRLDMPQLESFTGPLSILQPSDNSPEPLPLSNIKHLNVTSCLSLEQKITADPSFFCRFTHIETLTLATDITGTSAILLKLCASCTTLKELRFEGGMDLSHASDAKHLSKLINLRILEITAYKSLSPIDLSKVVQLEELKLNIQDIVKLPITIKKLEMHINAQEQVNSFNTFLTSSTQLRKLEINFRFSPVVCRYDVPRQILKALPLLKYLEILMFEGGFFIESFFQGIDGASMNNLRKLNFFSSRIYMQHAFIKEKFPNVKDINFLRCFPAQFNIGKRSEL